MPALTEVYTMKLTMELENPSGKTQIYRWHNLEFGPRIVFIDPSHENSKDTFLTITNYNDAEPPKFCLSDLLPPQGQEFVEIHLVAKVVPFDFEGHTTTLVVIDSEMYHELADAHACTRARATYVCTCGAKGTASLNHHSQRRGDDVLERAKKNHKAHADRARAAAEKRTN